METVGFIGLGNLGSPMAQNIQRQGYQMVVYDIQEGATKLIDDRKKKIGHKIKKRTSKKVKKS